MPLTYRGLSQEQFRDIAVGRGLSDKEQVRRRATAQGYWFSPIPTPGLPGAIGANVVGVALVGASLSKVEALNTSVAGTAAISPSLKTSRSLSTTVGGTSVVASALKVTRRFSTAVAGTSVVSAAVRLTERIASAILGSAAISAVLTIIGGAPAGISEALKRRRRMLRHSGGSSGRGRR